MTPVAAMTAQQRVQAAINGQPVDRVPATAWIHFGSEHLTSEETAALHLRFAREYQPDLLKIHADYRLRISHAHDLRDAADIRQIGLDAADSPCFVQQKPCVSAVLAALSDHSVVMETVLSPCQNLLRNVGSDQLPMLLRHPQHTLDTLARITEATCAHVRWLQAEGVPVCFFATHGAVAVLNHDGQPDARHLEIVERWIRPFDQQVLAAAAGMTRILHAHGQNLIMHRVRDYAFDILHVATELAGNPSLAELRQWTDKCLMGGVNENTFTRLSLNALADQMSAASTCAGQQGLILAPGCSLPPHTPARLLKALLN